MGGGGGGGGLRDFNWLKINLLLRSLSPNCKASSVLLFFSDFLGTFKIQLICFWLLQFCAQNH